MKRIRKITSDFLAGEGLPLLVLLCTFLFSVAVYAHLGTHNLDADQSSEMVLAQLLNEEGGFLSKNWYYSTELRVVSPVPVYQLALLLFDSWHHARIFSIVVLLLGLTFSLIYMLRGLGVREAGVYAVACLMLPVSWRNAFILVYGQFYTLYIIAICLLFGLLFRLRNGTVRWRKIAAMLLISIWCGMQGIRMLMLCAAPLMITIALTFFVRAGSCRTMREAGKLLRDIYAPEAIVIFAGIMAGYMVNELVFSRIYAYSSYAQTQFVGINWDFLFSQINMIPEYFGFVSGVNMISLDGVVNALALTIAFGSLINLIDMFRRRAAFSGKMRLLIGFAGASVLLGLAFNCMTDFGFTHGTNSITYYLPGIILTVVLAFVRVEKAYTGSKGIRTTVFLMMCMVFALNSVQYIRSGMKSNDADYEVRARDLVEHGYTTGFATFWNGNQLTEVSDGEIDVYVYNTWGDRYLYPWLQKKEHLENPHDGKVFVLIDTVEMTQNPPLAREENLICETYNGWIYGYDSAQQVMDIQFAENTARRQAENAFQ